MRVELFRGPRNEELIAKIAQTKGNAEAIEALWSQGKYSQTVVLDNLFYACEDGLITMDITDYHLIEWLEEELYKWLPEYLSDWVKDESNTSSRGKEREN